MRCPAKLNLTLAVGPPDHSPQGRGRHPIVSHMAAIDFFDTLEIHPLKNTPSRWHIAFAPDAPLPQPVDWPLEQDLAFRAHAAVEQHLRRAFPLDVQLTKRIPAGAGLGGGSADAAGMLFSLEKLLGNQLTADTQLKIARALGADVAFALLALQGQPAALATGFGDQLQPITLTKKIQHAALILPPFPCPTADVYQAFDHLNPPTHSPTHTDHTDADAKTPRDKAPAHLQKLRTGPPPPFFNDLTPAACHAQPKLQQLFDTLHHHPQLHPRPHPQPHPQPHLTGSGSAVFLPATTADHADALAKHAHQLTTFPALPIRIA